MQKNFSLKSGEEKGTVLPVGKCGGGEEAVSAGEAKTGDKKLPVRRVPQLVTVG